MQMSTSFIKYTIVLMVFSVVLIKCSATIPADTKLMRESENVYISAYELRDRLNIFAVRFSNSVERAADKIISKSNDPKIKENALLWKMNAIPAANQAIFLSDPMAALIDISALCIQMNNFLTGGNGKELFGELQYIASDATELLNDDVLKIWSVARGRVEFDSLEIATSPIKEWARENPIEDISFLRPSVSDTLFSIWSGGILACRKPSAVLLSVPMISGRG